MLTVVVNIDTTQQAERDFLGLVVYQWYTVHCTTSQIPQPPTLNMLVGKSD